MVTMFPKFDFLESLHITLNFSPVGMIRLPVLPDPVLCGHFILILQILWY